ncbi:Aste57867_6204 [Aphanomyces stellatus]|uniref:Aste57867_6203 protein n=1 Tax=Aphanomyces stellatus TaxID=120398 RepID=A0A485KHR8_9STRA|nr:hypothetical protein As57867_006189 [Aphanomyces stellatus]KAF0708808.1 hypothetical protein As57867_006190 [Aphanomyces stellatus]VFT83206.1 Aste57867_6203 [Aphanomyces stellatus]VFT83207.1 Aste57867_6204 [Aphanomyces stellatus]
MKSNTTFLALASMATIVTAANRPFDCTEGGDLFGDDLSHTEESRSDCWTDCQNDANCNGYTWVATQNNLGQCYKKHLQDLTRPISPTGVSGMVSCKQRPTQWVDIIGVNAQGNILATQNNVHSLGDCQQLCQETPGCTAVFHDYFAQTCQLQSNLQSFYHPWGPGKGINTAVSHTYKQCIGERDFYGVGDTFNFEGSFQDCRTCIDYLRGLNAFTWVPSETGGSVGHCWCKLVYNRQVDDSQLKMADAITCLDYP